MKMMCLIRKPEAGSGQGSVLSQSCKVCTTSVILSDQFQQS